MGGKDFCDAHVEDRRKYLVSLVDSIVNFESHYSLVDNDNRLYSRVVENGALSIDRINVSQVKTESCQALFDIKDIGNNCGFFWDDSLGKRITILNKNRDVSKYSIGRVMKKGMDDFFEEHGGMGYSSLGKNGDRVSLYDFIGKRIDDAFDVE